MLLAGPAEVAGLGAIVLFLGIVANPSYIDQYSSLRLVYAAGGFDSLTSFVTAVGIFMLLAVAISNTLLTLVAYFNLKLAWALHRRLTVRLTEAYLRKDMLWHLGQNTSELSKNILGEVQDVIQGVLNPTLSLCNSALRVALLVAFLFSVEPIVALVFFAVGGTIFSILVWLTQARLVQYGSDRRVALLTMYKKAGEMLSGIKEVKLFHGEEYLMGHFSIGVQNLGRSELRVGLVKSLPQYLLQTIALAGIVCVALFLFRTGAANEEVFTALGVFAVGGHRLMSAGQKAFASYSAIRFGSVSLENIRKELEAHDSLVQARSLSFERTIDAENLTFQYPGKSPVVRGISFSVQRYSKVAFVGATGAGKTTLLNLLLGLLSPTSGSILVDGQELDESRHSSWHKLIGYVPQDIFLLDDTILRNIAFAVPDHEIDMEAAKLAARIAQLDEFIERELKDGYDTVVGERGARLSGGQRQRLGIARALYRQPEIIVLDEATSALDGATEGAVIEGLETASLRKTVLVVAHRMSTIQRCDTIHLLKDGNLVASGSYEELFSDCEEFRSLAGAASADQSA